MSIDLINASYAGVRKFVNDVMELAIKDHANKRTKKRSGHELCDMFATDARRGHARMATGIYNQVRWTLDTSWGK